MKATGRHESGPLCLSVPGVRCSLRLSLERHKVSDTAPLEVEAVADFPARSGEVTAGVAGEDSKGVFHREGLVGGSRSGKGGDVVFFLF
jgi:hypothetical protein